MGGTATVITVSYAVFTAIGIVIAIALVRSTLVRRRRRVDPHELAEREKVWLATVVGFLVALLLATIFLVPYGASARGDAQVVRVRAFQFAWQVEPNVIKAGKQVEFQFESMDVNHDFGVYSPSGVYIFQAQVQPGRVQKAVHTFTQRGTYSVLCLEFCGVGHHNMKTQFEVR